MKIIIICIVSLCLLISCQKAENNNDKIKDLYNFKLDSIRSFDRKMIVYITDEFHFYDPVQNHQKTFFLLKDLKIDNSQVDFLEIHYNMPNREDGNLENEIPIDFFIENKQLYDDLRLREIMSFIMELDSIDENNYFLGGLNTDFAYLWLKEEALEKAFSGINSIHVIRDYLNDCKKSNSPAISVINAYKDKYSDSTNLDSKLIKKLNFYCN